MRIYRILSIALIIFGAQSTNQLLLLCNRLVSPLQVRYWACTVDLLHQDP